MDQVDRVGDADHDQVRVGAVRPLEHVVQHLLLARAQVVELIQHYDPMSLARRRCKDRRQLLQRLVGTGLLARDLAVQLRVHLDRARELSCVDEYVVEWWLLRGTRR